MAASILDQMLHPSIVDLEADNQVKFGDLDRCILINTKLQRGFEIFRNNSDLL